MLYEKLLDTINRIFPIDPLADVNDQLSKLNPDKIYIENVRSLLGVSTSKAKHIIETAVQRGDFSQFIEVLCPNGAVACTARNEQELPKTVNCWQEVEGEYAQKSLLTSHLKKLVFYKYNG